MFCFFLLQFWSHLIWRGFRPVTPKKVPGQAASTSSGNVLEMRESQPYPRMRNARAGARNLCFDELPGLEDYRSTFYSVGGWGAETLHFLQAPRGYSSTVGLSSTREDPDVQGSQSVSGL